MYRRAECEPYQFMRPKKVFIDMHAGSNKIREKISNARLIEFLIILCEFTAKKKKKKKIKSQKFRNKINGKNYLINRSIELRIVCFCKTWMLPKYIRISLSISEHKSFNAGVNVSSRRFFVFSAASFAFASIN